MDGVVTFLWLSLYPKSHESRQRKLKSENYIILVYIPKLFSSLLAQVNFLEFQKRKEEKLEEG